MEECRAVAKRCRAALEMAILSEFPVTLSDKTYASGDLSLELGKDPFKVPRFSRFAKPPRDIQASVMRMRALTQARKAFRTRSWEAAFSFTRRSMRVPKFERFGKPPGNITEAVQEMRLLAAAKRANKQKSWAGTFSFARSWKKPKFERFANPPADIMVAVQEMRLVAVAKLAEKQKSQAAAVKLARNSKNPRLGRPASPPSDIASALRKMGQRLMSERAAGKTRDVALEDQVLIEDVQDEPAESTSVPTSKYSGGMLMLTAPPSELEQIRHNLFDLLAGFEREIKDENNVKQFVQQSAFPAPCSEAASFSPAEPPVQASFDSDPETFGLKGPEVKPPGVKAVREACEHCAKLLRQFRKQADIYKEEQQSEELFRQEQLRFVALEEEADRNVEQLIAEELGTAFKPKPVLKSFSKGAGLLKGCTSYQSTPSLPGTTTEWFAGSSLSAVRRLRSDRLASEADGDAKPKKTSAFSSNLFRLDSAGDLAFKGAKLGGNADARSAMEMDLGTGEKSGNKSAMEMDLGGGSSPHANQRLSKSSSLGALKVTKSMPMRRAPLQPVVDWR